MWLIWEEGATVKKRITRRYRRNENNRIGIALKQNDEIMIARRMERR